MEIFFFNLEFNSKFNLDPPIRYSNDVKAYKSYLRKTNLLNCIEAAFQWRLQSFTKYVNYIQEKSAGTTGA